MFWKKEKPHKPDISLESSSNRDTFRYVFKPDNTLTVSFLDQPVRLVNISAGGLAFMNIDFKKDQADLIEFDLDIPNYIGRTFIAVTVRILEIDAQNICHCVFEDCSEAQQDIIHKYLLEMQKKELKSRMSHDSSS